MFIDRKKEKQYAKDLLRQAQVSPYAMTAIFVGIGIVLNIILLLTGIPEVEFQYGLTLDEAVYYLPRLITLPPIFGTFLVLLTGLLLTTLQYGYYSYSMTVRAGNRAEYGTLLDGFTYVGKIVLTELLMWLYVMLWSLLAFVPLALLVIDPWMGLLLLFPLMILGSIPGVVAAYRYRFARFNLCENPDLRPGEAIRMSKMQTRGLKWQLFVLDLSFFGWEILALLTFGLVNIYVMPYRVQTELGFYEHGKRASGVGAVPGGAEEHDGQFHGLDV